MSNLEYIQVNLSINLERQSRLSCRNLRDIPYPENLTRSFLFIFLIVPCDISPVDAALVLNILNQTSYGMFKNDPISRYIPQFHLRGRNKLLVHESTKLAVSNLPVIQAVTYFFLWGRGRAFSIPSSWHGPKSLPVFLHYSKTGCPAVLAVSWVLFLA